MDNTLGSSSSRGKKSRKRRTPKACTTCRRSKVSCDQQRPCSRCIALQKTCTYVDRPKGAEELEIERLRTELDILRSQTVPESHASLLANNRTSGEQSTLLPHKSSEECATGSNEAFNTTGLRGHVAPSPSTIGGCAAGDRQSAHTLSTIAGQQSRDVKRRQVQFEVKASKLPSFVETGLLNEESARIYFRTFFEGCDKFVPAFDPQYDTYDSVLARNGLLFNSICAVGSEVHTDTDTQIPRLLNFHHKKSLNLVVLDKGLQCLETVQALLVTACYTSERSLTLSVAARMALDLGLAEAYDELSTRLVMQDMTAAVPHGCVHDAMLMRRARTWFSVLLLEHILRVDAGDLPGFSLRGGARRCRVMLGRPFSTSLDLRLFSQIELNFMRIRVQEALETSCGSEDTELQTAIRDAKIDVGIWYEDWKGIIKRHEIRHGSDTAIMLLNLTVQKHWTEAMALCRALRATGVDNVANMSTIQRSILRMAYEAVDQHLATILEEPRLYLSQLKYAMDYVWAKCAFCFLLQTKLASLISDTKLDAKWQLLHRGGQLLTELEALSSPPNSPGDRSRPKAIYLQVLRQSLAKYQAVLDDENRRLSSMSPSNPTPNASFPFSSSSIYPWNNNNSNNNSSGSSSNNLNSFQDHDQDQIQAQSTAQIDLESYIPEQFIFEWDFPGLTLFSIPTPAAFDDYFDNFLTGQTGMQTGWWQTTTVGDDGRILGGGPGVRSGFTMAMYVGAFR